MLCIYELEGIAFMQHKTVMAPQLFYMCEGGQLQLDADTWWANALFPSHTCRHATARIAAAPSSTLLGNPNNVGRASGLMQHSNATGHDTIATMSFKVY